MSTAGTGTKTQTTTITRTDLLIKQIALIVQSTTGSKTFRFVIEQGIKNKWIEKVFIDGVTENGLIRQQIRIVIDWNRHQLLISDPQEKNVKVNLAREERNWVSSVIGQLIDGFNEITEEADLEAIWSITYRPELEYRRDELNKILGLVRAKPREFEAGTVADVIHSYRPKKLSEMELYWKVVTKK